MIILSSPQEDFLEIVYNTLQKLGIHQTKVILPTVACCIKLQQIIVEKSPNFAAILPQIVPIMNVGIEGDSIYEAPSADLQLISKLEQKIIITNMVIEEDTSISISEALDLSSYIIKLFEELSEYELDINDFIFKPISLQENDIWHELADHWKDRSSFLEKIYRRWQQYLASNKRIDFSRYKQNMLAQEIESAKQEKYKIILAGIFPKGNILEKLADIIANSKNSCLILPPIEKFTQNINKTHYFYNPNLLLEKYHLTPKSISKRSNKGDNYIFENMREEAEFIFLEIQQLLQANDNAKISIICRNDELIKSIENRLDSASIPHINLQGYKIGKTKPYEFFIQIAESFEDNGTINSEKFIHLLKSVFLYSKESRDFEINLRKNHQALENDILTELSGFKPNIKAHIAIAEKLAPEIWQSNEGRILSDFLFELLQINFDFNLNYETYFDFIKAISKDHKYHMSISNQKVIFTTLENADLCGDQNIIIADFNEDSIPGKVSLDPWMSPKMRENVGLSDLSEKIGIDWYHYKNLLYRGNVINTRSLKKNGSSTIASRFLY